MAGEFDFRGKTMLVTGSGRNIGRAIILEFAAHGANVVINTKSNLEEARSVEKEAQRLGAATAVVMGDAADLSVIEELKSVAEERFGRVDMYVSNAARRLYRDFFETTNEDWHYYLNQQLTASWYLAKAFVPGMREAGWGRIIHMNGPDGWVGGWTRAPHSSAKGALRTLTKSLATGLGEYGITVNDINPGHTETIRDLETHPTDTADNEAAFAKTLPMRKMPQPDDIAWACVYLCSPRSQTVTGSVVHVDAGRHMFG